MTEEKKCYCDCQCCKKELKNVSSSDTSDTDNSDIVGDFFFSLKGVITLIILAILLTCGWYLWVIPVVGQELLEWSK